MHDNWQDGTVVLFCPAPCPGLTLVDEQQRLTVMSGACESCSNARIEGFANDSVSPVPTLLNRLVQAAFLLEMSMKSSVTPSSSQEIRQLGLKISTLACALHEDRCRGADVNCSILGLCVRSVAVSLTRPSHADKQALS